jgi:diguanylate cyclase (GGDEF)-like protein/PAS domain S-box-containing protein
MPKKSNLHTAAAPDQELRDRLEKAEASLREILSGESDALFVSGQGGAQLFTLQGADQSYRTLIENMSEGALTLTPQGLILYANRRFAEMLRTPLEKVIGSKIPTWFAAESRQVLQTLLQKDALDNRREELALAAADGTQVPVNLSVSHLILDGVPDSFCMVATDLTEQKRNEAFLADEALKQAILDQAADAIVICDETGRIIRASKQAQALYGNNPVGQDFEHAFPLCESDGTAFSPIGAIYTSHRPSVEARLERNGQRFELLVSVGRLKSALNELLGTVVTLTDITERKRADVALRESEARFRALTAMSSDFYWESDTEHRLTTRVSANTKPSMVSEFQRGAQIGQRRWEIPHLSPDEAGWQAHRAVLDAHLPFRDFELSRLGAGGEERHISISGDPMFDAQAAFKGYRGVGTDITKRKKADQKFKDLLESAPDAVVIVNRDAEIVLVNARTIELFGWLREELMGQKIGILVPERFRRQHLEDKSGYFGQPRARAMGAGLERFGLRKDGTEFPVDISLSPLETDEGPLVISAIRDITERKAAERMITRLNRVYAVLSGINTLIVRVRDRDELFKEACRIAVEAGGFHMSLIAIVDRTVMKFVSVASAGVDEDLLAAIKGLLSSNEGAASTMLARAIREKKTAVSNDLQSDPRVVFGKKYVESGVRSMAILPLIISDEAVGVLVLYTRESEFFREEELKLLTELAGDIAFAIDHLDKQERLNYLAYYDVLTGLANRTLFLDRLRQYKRSAVSGGHQLALFLLDLERFRNINDSLGRPTGDELLRQVAQWLTHNAAGDGNLVARVGVDIFALVMPQVKQGGDLARLLERWMKEFLEHPFRLNDAVFRIAAKVGVALFPDDGADAETLFRNAEAALKKAKASGQRYLFYQQDMTAAVAGKLTLENQLRQAINKGEFVLHYQPKVNLASGKMTSAEALIRWNDPRTGLVPPGRFIPILEETGMIYEVGRWVLRQAIADCLRWRNAGLPVVRIAVNVSPLQLRHRGFIAEIEQAIGVDPQAAAGLELEITESVIMEDVKGSIATLQAIRALGITIAIDDFGTGFSSLSYLAKLPLDTLKIDISFVNDMTTGPQGLALVSTIISLAHSLNLKVVAEGVETEEQQRLLRLLGCDEMQGYLFSKPVPGELFESRFLAPPTPSAG